MTFVMKYSKGNFPFKGDDDPGDISPTGELLDVLKRHGKGTERGTINGRDMTPNELAANRYLTKQVQNIPEKHRSDFAYTLQKGRLEGDTHENQAKVLWEMQNK
tara:strand:+ start:111 stop:422 length:312 start_codon:yes stop_codon:yes gene_type:complete